MRQIPVRGPLTCPHDRTELRPFRVGDLEVDTCLTCTGVWLDQGELARVAHDVELEAIVSAARGPTPSPFACPRCAGECGRASVEGIELDACASCGGIWVDAEELHGVRVRVLAARAPGGRGLAPALRDAAERARLARAG